jgi:nucleoside-diphosphate-sugar epimerase
MPEYQEFIHSGKLELHVTGDLLDGDYTKAIKGVAAVVHVASPVEFGDKEFKESHLAPAVHGTRGVLDAAAKEASVKAVVMTGTIGMSYFHATSMLIIYRIGRRLHFTSMGAKRE